MKPGSPFQRMTPETRMRHVAAKTYDFREIYQSPEELVGDVKTLLDALDQARKQLDDATTDLRRLVNARDEISNEISAAFKKWDFLYSCIPSHNKGPG
jgi:uncharacterized coiled-coil DUF342 family protein